MADDSNGGYGFAPRPQPGMQTQRFGAAPTTIGNGQNAQRARMLGTTMGQTPAYRQNFGNADGARTEQEHALGLTRDAAMGAAPSRAELLGKQMIGDSLSAQLAGAASARGGPMQQAAAQRQVQQGAAAFQQNGANNIAGMRADEMANARNAYAQQAGAIRSGDLGQVGMQTQNEQFQRGLNAQQQMGYEGMANQLDTAQAQMGQQNNQFNAGLGQQNDQFGRSLSEQHWAGQAGLNQHAVDRSTGLWSQIGGGILSGAGGIIGGLISDPRSKTNMRDMSMGGGTTPWMPPEPKVTYSVRDPHDNFHDDVEFIRFGANADQGALDDRYAQMAHPPAEWLPDYSSVDLPGVRGPEMGVAGAPKGYAASRMGQPGSMFKPPADDDSPRDGDLAPGTSDWNRYGGDGASKSGDPDWTKGGATPKGDASGLGGAVSGGIKDLGGGLQKYGANLMKSDPRSKMGIMPMNSVDPETGTVQLHGGGMSSSDLIAAGSGLAGPQPVAGMVGGGGITGGSVNTAGRGSDGTVNTMGRMGGGGIISDPAAKQKMFDLGKSEGRSEVMDDLLAPLSGDEPSFIADKSKPVRAAYANFLPPVSKLISAVSEARGKPEDNRRDQQMALDESRRAWGFEPDRAEHAEAAPPARMMDAIGGGKAFQYRPGVAGEDPTKQHFGTTTEDLKKTPMGASMVEPGSPLTDGFDAINTKEAVGPMLASLGNLNQRMRALEAMKKGGR